MVLSNNASKTRLWLFLILVFSAAFVLQSCKKSRSDIGKLLFDETKNKVYKNIEAEAFAEAFKKRLAEKQSSLRNPKLIVSFYEHADYEPVLINKHFPKQSLKILADYLNKAEAHGLDPEIFKAKSFSSLLNKIYEKKGVQSTEEAYTAIADLEIMAANSLINYSNALQYGLISPRRIYAMYYTETKRPDSTSMSRIFKVDQLKSYLDSIQPKDPKYLSLQKALQNNIAAMGLTTGDTKRLLQVNMERLRWKNKYENENKYVVVNIPDFYLDVIDQGKSILRMKVCVGEGRDLKYTDKLEEYDENDLKKDRPFTRETPQLRSMIHSVQVNPVWNIPESIATNEITKYAAKDRYYLANNNIDVYKDGQLVQDPELIDWSEGTPGKTYSFKQRPGDDNSLGKIKFLFNNESAVYLHDTPAQAAFKQPMRAVSHGCVRVEKPLELAYALFGNGDKYNTIKEDMKSDNPKARDIALDNKIPVYLTYFTAWADDNEQIQFRKDIYGLDVVLYSYMEKSK
jgi:murein L,D-transpeptidase YcbB/YkuD